jgi:uncharacterized protein YxjI
MEELAGLDGLVVSQKKEWGEILTGFETRNRYAVLDTSGRPLYTAGEEGGSFLARVFLKAMRPFHVMVRSPDARVVIEVERPFRFFFHLARIYDGKRKLLGTVERRFTLLRRVYSVLDRSGNEVCQLFGPILHPWTFEIRRGDRVFGKITKKWSGLLKEAFTDADNFGVTFPADWDPEVKAVFLGAVFLVDFVHFESTGGRS